ncbi:hypothetical protein Tco_1213368 [Tanacetum coccineum]
MFSSNATLLPICGSSFLDGVIFLFFKLLLGILSLIGSSIGIASKEKKHRFYVITTSVLWWLWRYRNSVTFSSQPLRKSDIFDNVRFSSFSWLHNRVTYDVIIVMTGYVSPFRYTRAHSTSAMAASSGLCKGYVLNIGYDIDHNVIPGDNRLSADIGNLIMKIE